MQHESKANAKKKYLIWFGPYRTSSAASRRSAFQEWWMRHIQLKYSVVEVTVSKISSISFYSVLFLWWLNLKFLWDAAESLLP